MKAIPFEERKRVNFDHPGALEWELLAGHLRALAAGRGFEEPDYSFAEHVRTSRARPIEPAEYVIIEGLFTFHWPELRALLDTKVYVETGAGECYRRRLARDTAERGRTPESVREQYESTVRPGAEQFVYPSRRFADVVVSGEQPPEDSVAAVLRAVRSLATIRR